MRNIILADNQEITKAGILYLLDRVTGLGTITEVDNKRVLVQALIVNEQAMVVLDYTLFDLSGIEELLILQQRFQEVRWFLFSEELSDDFVRRLIYSSDSFSVVMKDCSAQEITDALQYASHSEQYVCSRVKTLLLHKHPESSGGFGLLTVTEKEILKLIALGKTTKEIASERFSSIHTIITHRKNIFRKLEVNNIHEATKYAVRAGIVDLAEYYI